MHRTSVAPSLTRPVARPRARSRVLTRCVADENARARVAGAALATAMTLLSCSPALADAPGANAAAPTSAFAGRYADKKHPGCYREIFPDGVVAGEDGDPGCDATTPRTRAWRLRGVIGVDDRSIFIDFSPKGGPANLIGTLVSPTSEYPRGGVAFPDGNVWAKTP